MKSVPRICWIQRKKANSFFSIEKVFNTIKPFFIGFEISECQAKSRSVKPGEIIKNGRHFRKQEAEVYHITGDVHYAALFLPGNKTVLTIHDCVFLYHPNRIKRWLLKWFWLKLPVRRAKYVTTISEKSKQEILANCTCEPDKIIVIPDPVDTAFSPGNREFNVKQPQLLQVGVKANKNLERVIQAITDLPCKLEVVGKLNSDQIELLTRNKIEFENHYDLTEQELVDAYKRNDALVFASLYEGFGLPLIEAQATGIPVITSDIEPMKSNSGGAAVLIDPSNVVSIREGILAVIRNGQYRNELIKSGLENAQRFHPLIISDAYIDIYKKILNN